MLDNKTIVIALIAVMAFAALRIISRWRGFSFKPKKVDWDEHFIHGLRKAGVNTFIDHTVDFFFTVPTREQAEQLGHALRGEGYEIDIVDSRNVSGQFSLHASRRMRLIVEEMQKLTVHFNALAAQHGAQYDNWAVVTK